MYSSKNHSICEEGQIDLSKSKYGIITSPSYPKWQQNTKCFTKLTAPVNKHIRVYITDLNTESADENNECTSGHLSLLSSGTEIKYCGDKTPNGEYVFLSCSNDLEIYYRSSAILSTTYRGFNLYYEVIDDRNVLCPNVTAPQRTTRSASRVNVG